MQKNKKSYRGKILVGTPETDYAATFTERVDYLVAILRVSARQATSILHEMGVEE